MEIYSRRELLTKGLKTAAAVGLGAGMLGTLGDRFSIIDKAWANFDPKALTYQAEETCVLTCTSTLGPCYYSTGLVRSDLRESYAGLNTKLIFRIVNADTCLPVPNASIDIWHTNAIGAYSAPISTFCNGTDPANQAARFCRGIQNTDSNGVATFTTLYPGWYSGRTVHIHATIRIGTTAMATTQFFFNDKISDYVFANHLPYSGRGTRNTINSNDNVIGGTTWATRILPFLFSTNVLRDRSLVCTKTIAIRTTPTTCAA